MSKQAFKSLFGVLFALLLFVAAVMGGQAILPAFADEAHYTGVLDDLRKDNEFNADEYKDGFTLDLTKEKTPQAVLEKIFLGEVMLPQGIKQDYYFAPVVTSAMGEAVTINFNTQPNRMAVVGIEPDNEEVFFF